MKPLILATRQSPLALAQTRMAAACLQAALGVETTERRIVTTGDRQATWSLEEKGGKGLFTGELEESLRRGEADLAVHSTKDLPGGDTPGLAIAGYLPRADARDVLVIRAGLARPATIATNSARRRLQIAALFPDAQFTGLRGNVDTRLKKVAAGAADATVLAAAGLARLGIASWPGLEFRPLSCKEMVPAVGQGAVALQCRAGEEGRFRGALDAATERAVSLERAIQRQMGGGCHTALGAHATAAALYFFYESVGFRTVPLGPEDFLHPAETARALLARLGVRPVQP